VLAALSLVSAATVSIEVPTRLHETAVSNAIPIKRTVKILEQ